MKPEIRLGEIAMAYELEEFCNDCREAIQSDPGDGGREVIRDKETSLAEGLVERLLFSERRGRTLGNIASVAFGGSDLRTVYLGSLGGTSLAVFRSPVAGLPLGHWRNL
jgi:hypothetical protein